MCSGDCSWNGVADNSFCCNVRRKGTDLGSQRDWTCFRMPACLHWSILLCKTRKASGFFLGMLCAGILFAAGMLGSLAIGELHWVLGIGKTVFDAAVRMSVRQYWGKLKAKEKRF